jgi:ABC-type branched-subunit amino acid transport system permease subunit
VGFPGAAQRHARIGWNIIGGWARQFDFGPSIFFAIGAHTAALVSIHRLERLARLVGAVVSRWCSAPRLGPTRSRGCAVLPAIATVAMVDDAQPIGHLG